MGLLIILQDGSVKYGAVASPIAIPLPSDVSLDTCLRPSFVSAFGRTVIAGKYQPGLIVDESLSAWRLGVQAPLSAPVLTGTGSGVITGSNIGYLTFAHKIGGAGGKLVARSNLGPPSTAVTLTAQKRNWASLPTSSPDKRVNVIEGWVSFAGGIPRFCWEAGIGISSFIDDIPTLSLGAPTPTNNGIVTYNRLPPPSCAYVVPYRARQWYSGNKSYTYRTWYTPIGELEGVGIATYLDTRDKEAVTGLGPLDDHLVVFGRKVAYAIQGLGITGADFEIEKISPTVGCVSHAGIVNIHRRLFFPAQNNIYMYDGAFHPLLTGKKQRDYAADYKASEDPFFNSIAVDDYENERYLLLTPRSTEPKTIEYSVFYGDLLPEAGGGGGGVEITRDQENRKKLCLVTTTASSPEVLYAGYEDQFVRLMNVASNADDDADTLLKKITLKHPHFFFGEQAGDDRDGKTWKEFWAHLESENVATTVKIWCGDERAADGDVVQTLTFGPGALTSQVIKSLYTTILKRATGRGITVQIEVSSPDSAWRYRGFGGNYLPGVSRRGTTEPSIGQQG